MSEGKSARVLVVTSGKGGVGKTTSTAALGAALAHLGQKVVVVDFDVGLRNLDLVMGAERRVVFDLINVIQGDAKLPQALIRDKRLENLSLLPASQTRDKDALTEEGVAKVIAELRTKFDWIICDSPAGIERGATLAMRHRRRRHRRHQSGSLVGARLRPHHRPARLQDRKGRARRAHREAPAAHPLPSVARGARRDAVDRRRAGDPFDPAARHHPRERGSAARFQRRLADYAECAARARRPKPISTPPSASRANKSPCRFLRKAAASSTSCSDGKQHEPAQPVSPGLRAGCARAPANPPRARARDARSQPDLLGVLREEILAVIARHVAFDPDKVQITMDRGSTVSTLAVDIEIPNRRRASGAASQQLSRLALSAGSVATRSQWTNGLV